jgi:putative nucleotidyltransferase with HDIG domain
MTPALSLSVNSYRSELRLMYPGEPGLLAHCHRVAALAWEIGRVLELSSESQLCLGEAALTHHYPIRLLESDFVKRVLADIYGPAANRLEADSPAIPAGVRSILELFHSERRGRVAPGALLADILDFCNLFDEQMEGLPFEDASLADAVEELLLLARQGLWDPALTTALEQLLRARDPEFLPQTPRLPVSPAAAIRALALNPEAASLDRLEQIALSDAVLEADILRAANSPGIESVKQAISSMGVEAARKILLTAAIGRLFESERSSALWLHSVRTAELMARLAAASGAADPEAAFVVGLLHDIGRPALHNVGGELGEMQTRLLEKNCPPVWVEALICRQDHGEIGANILKKWNVPRRLTDPIRWHHRPELSESPLTSLLYLAECESEADEDLPSSARSHRALSRTGLTLSLLSTHSSQTGPLEELVRAKVSSS